MDSELWEMLTDGERSEYNSDSISNSRKDELIAKAKKRLEDRKKIDRYVKTLRKKEGFK